VVTSVCILQEELLMAIITLPTVVTNDTSGLFKHYCGGGLTPAYTSSSSVTKTINSEYESIIRAKKRLPPLPYHRSGSTATDHPGTMIKTRNEDGWVVYSYVSSFFKCFGGTGSYTGKTMNDVVAQATTNFFSNAGKLQKVNAGESLVEAKQSLSMITSSATKIATFMLNVKRGRFRKAFGVLGLEPQRKLPKHLRKKLGVKQVNQMARKKRKEYLLHKRKRDYSALARQASDTWLELHFGWFPLVEDIYSFSEAITDVLYATRPEVLTIKGYAEENMVFNLIDPDNSSGSGSKKRQCLVQASYYIDNVEIYNQQTMGLNNPAQVLWAVQPYSFVVDWVFPISKYLDSLSALAGLKWLDGFTTKSEHETSSRIVDQSTSDQWFSIRNTGSGSTSSFYVSRIVGFNPISPPPPQLQLGEMLDAWKATTALALMKSALVYR